MYGRIGARSLLCARRFAWNNKVFLSHPTPVRYASTTVFPMYSRRLLCTPSEQEEQPSKVVKGRMAAIFTCNVCKTREKYEFSKHSYEEGVVLVRCSGCQNLHLVADHLGWFGPVRKTLETIANEKGASLHKIDMNKLLEQFSKGAAEIKLDVEDEDENEMVPKKHHQEVVKMENGVIEAVKEGT